MEGWVGLVVCAGALSGLGVWWSHGHCEFVLGCGHCGCGGVCAWGVLWHAEGMEIRDDLDYKRPSRQGGMEAYWGATDVVVRCEGSLSDPLPSYEILDDDGYPVSDSSGRERRRVESTLAVISEGQGMCARCNFISEVTADDKMVEHGRALAVVEQAQMKLVAVAEVLGLSTSSSAVRQAVDAARSAADGNVDMQVAAGLPYLVSALTVRGATADVGPAVDELVGLLDQDVVFAARAAVATESLFDEEPDLEEAVPADAPVFSEAVLYPLMGKGPARTILGLVDQLRRVSGR